MSGGLEAPSPLRRSCAPPDPAYFRIEWNAEGELTRGPDTLLDLVVRRRPWAAGLPRPVSPHVVRHSCATHLLRGGAGVRQVQELLGHRSLQTTALYTRVEVEDLRAVIRRCHPRERARRGEA